MTSVCYVTHACITVVRLRNHEAGNLALQRPSTVGCDTLSSYHVEQVAALLRSGEEIPVPRNASQNTTI